jgi:hypothetical protein
MKSLWGLQIATYLTGWLGLMLFRAVRQLYLEVQLENSASVLTSNIDAEVTELSKEMIMQSPEPPASQCKPKLCNSCHLADSSGAYWRIVQRNYADNSRYYIFKELSKPVLWMHQHCRALVLLPLHNNDSADVDRSWNYSHSITQSGGTRSDKGQVQQKWWDRNQSRASESVGS